MRPMKAPITLPGALLLLLVFLLEQVQAQDNAQQNMGEIVAESAHGAASGTVFVAAVSGQSTETILAVTTATINGFTAGIAESAVAEGAVLSVMLSAIQQATQSEEGLQEVADSVLQLAEALDLPAENLANALESYENGDITKGELGEVLVQTTDILPGANNAFEGLVNQFLDPSPNLEILEDFAGQVVVLLVVVVPRVDLMVAMAIQGAIRGAMEAARNAGLDSAQIAAIQQAAQDISPVVASALGGISIADILANAPFDTLLEQSEEEPALIDLDDPILTQPSEAFTLTVDPVFFDSDNDGLLDITEEQIGTDPKDPDTDGDLLKDGSEVLAYGSDPLQNDTDGDGVSDSIEVGLGEDPTVANAYGTDTDNDGLPDEFEAIVGTDPTHNDTDGDGWWDSFEIGVGSGFLTAEANNPLVRNIRIDGTPFTVSPVGKEKVQTWLVNYIFIRE